MKFGTVLGIVVGALTLLAAGAAAMYLYINKGNIFSWSCHCGDDCCDDDDLFDEFDDELYEEEEPIVESTEEEDIKF